MEKSNFFGNPEEIEEALERNKKLAIEGKMDMKQYYEETVQACLGNDNSNPEEFPTIDDREALWNYIFFLTEEIKKLKGEKDDK